ncbi:hypothetical protein [Sphingomonas sp. BK235]|uniref:hypothetical protein n=1 Tax=Sphingomonas sp. BK235 TaxID=2512131 RepID=UPI00104F9927|nr:hypothetical protein [Sphingomonas sp. BK235]TCP29662.1 hypothetical protein EV292_11613 [Sphingomonas sp. BK235]
MFHAVIEAPPPGADPPADFPATPPPPADALAALAGELDHHFLAAGQMLASAVGAVQRVVAALEGVTRAIDAEAAVAAVDDLRAVARRLTGLADTQATRDAELGAIARELAVIRARVLDMRDTLRLLEIYAPNIKIAASGEPVFVEFVDGMRHRLHLGEQHIAHILAELATLERGLARGHDASARLLAEGARVVPAVPDRLEQDAAALDRYRAALRHGATELAAAARSVAQRVASALNALQVGDSTRQRIEHVVATLALAEAAGDAAVAAHLRALAAAQTQALAAEFAEGAARLAAALRAIGDETGRLLALIGATAEGDGAEGDGAEGDGADGDGAVALAELDRDIAAVSALTARLHDADRDTELLVRLATDALDGLGARCDGLRLIRRDVGDIAVNTRLLCRRFGTMGRAVAVVAVEVGACATQLDRASAAITTAMAAVSAGGAAIAAAQRRAGGAAGDRLALAAEVIRAGCAASERGVRDGAREAHALIAELAAANATLERPLALADEVAAIGVRLGAAGARAADALPEAADALLRTLLAQVAGSYTMAAERAVHATFLLPGMADAPVAPVEEDGLF